ncbi:MAG: c-type cytochrome domain-containing protein [Bacteroidota bacterium]
MQTTPDFIIFLGRFHPLVVHLPIGFLLIAGILEFLSRKKKYAAFRESVGMILFISSISAILAVVMGLMLAEGGGYDRDLLSSHKWWGFGVAGFSVLAWLGKTQPAWLPLKSMMQKAYVPLLGLGILSLGLAGHMGGSLTHGSDYLVQYAPQPVRSLAGLPPKKAPREPITDVQEAVLFADLVQPVLDAKCVSCHRAGKKKGGLRMDTPDQLLKGGKHGEAFVVGEKDESNLFIRVSLPEEDEDHMPPEGKTPMTEDEIALLAWWIDSGASLDQKIAEMEVPEHIQPVLDKLGDGTSKPGQDGIFAKSVPPADPAAIEALRAEGVLVQAISQETNFLQVVVQKDTTPFGDAQMQLLLPLREQITWLDLQHTEGDDYSILAQMPHLSRIHLENSPVEDDDLQHLTGLSELNYLNLYGTAVSNAGLTHLGKLTKLEKLFLWQTQVDSTGALALQKSLPQVEFNLGW